MSVDSISKGVSDESRLLSQCSDEGDNRSDFLWQRGWVFDFGPTIEYTILVHDLLISTLLAGFGVCCSNMGLEEHRRVQGRFFNNRNCGSSIFSGICI